MKIKKIGPKKKNEYSLQTTKKGKQKNGWTFWENWQLKWYRYFSTFGLTKHFVWNIRKIYEIMRPASEKNIILNTMKVLEGCFFVSFGLLLFASTLKGASIYIYLIVFSLIFILSGQVISTSLWKEEYRLLVQLEKYLGDVRHYYHIGGLVEDAVYDSLEEAPYEISLHMQKIYDVLLAKEEEETEKYKEIAPNKFFKTFMALCQITMEYGDTIWEEKSLFLTNLNYLRNEIHIELLKRDKIQYTFSGLIIVTILPVFFLKAIEDWSTSNLPELESYYHGRYGILVSVSIFLVTIFTYLLIQTLKEEKKVIKTEHWILKKIIQISWVKKYLEMYFFYYPGKIHSLERLLRNSGNQLSVGEFLVQKVLLFLGGLVGSVAVFFNVSMIEEGFYWYYWIFSVLIAIIVCYAPQFILEIKRYFLKSMMEDEVMQFQTIILMLMYIPRMNVEIILEWLENFSDIFKASIMECVDLYFVDHERALAELKEKEPFPSLVRIAEDLQACDQVGIVPAFDEIAGQRSYFMEKRKQDNEIQIANKGAIGKAVAYVPMILVIGLYLIVPFVLESLSQLGGYMLEMELF